MKISVIVPVFNSAPYLRECIESILASENAEIELILIDDGSTDESGAICDEYDALVIHRENRGVAASRNEGVRLATGDYIAFVDSDDLVEPEHFCTMLDFAAENSCDVVISGLKKFDENPGKPTGCETIDSQPGVYVGNEITNSITNKIISGGEKTPLKHPSTGSSCICLYKTELVRDTEFPSTSISEDLIFQINILSKAERVGKLDGFTYCYRVIGGRDTRSGKYAPELWEQQLELLGYMDSFDEKAVAARTVYQALRCSGHECVKLNKKPWYAKIRRIRDILGNERVRKSLSVLSANKYPARTGLILTLMRMRTAALIFLYLSVKKRKGG